MIFEGFDVWVFGKSLEYCSNFKKISFGNKTSFFLLILGSRTILHDETILRCLEIFHFRPAQGCSSILRRHLRHGTFESIGRREGSVHCWTIRILVYFFNSGWCCYPDPLCTSKWRRTLGIDLFLHFRLSSSTAYAWKCSSYLLINS